MAHIVGKFVCAILLGIVGSEVGCAAGPDVVTRGELDEQLDWFHDELARAQRDISGLTKQVLWADRALNEKQDKSGFFSSALSFAVRVGTTMLIVLGTSIFLKTRTGQRIELQATDGFWKLVEVAQNFYRQQRGN